MLLFLVLICVAKVQSANILHIAALNGISHHNWNTAIATELAQRGHKVTFVSIRPIENPHPNMDYHHYVHPDEILSHWNVLLQASIEGSPVRKIRTFAQSGLMECDHFFKDPPFKDFLKPDYNKSFDLVMFESPHYDCLLGLSVRFDAPVVVLSPLTHSPSWFFRLLGVPIFQAFPHMTDDRKPPLGLWDRIMTLGLCLYEDFNYYTNIRPGMDEVNRKYFGEDIPKIDKLVDRIALGLINIPDWLNKVPLPANVIPVGGLHIKNPNPLTGDLKKFLDGAGNGAILISFGTVFSTTDVKLNTLRDIMSALARLPQKVVWKWDQGSTDGLVVPANVLLLPWVLQNDVLGHPNLRVFVSHCGGHSTLEAVYHGVPVLGIPAFWDQRENANSLSAEGTGIRLDFKDITEETFYQSIKELTDNPKYLEEARRLQYSFRDQATQPMERAMFYIEFVIRHKGAPHLRPILWDLFPNAIILDIVLVTIIGVLIFTITLAAIYFVIRSLKKCITPVHQKTKKH